MTAEELFEPLNECVRKIRERVDVFSGTRAYVGSNASDPECNFAYANLNVPFGYRIMMQVRWHLDAEAPVLLLTHTGNCERFGDPTYIDHGHWSVINSEPIASLPQCCRKAYWSTEEVDLE